MATAMKLDDLVTCPVCFEIYDNPQSLTCLHVLCQNCVISLMKSIKVECPECRNISWLNEIRKDFNKQNLVDVYHQQEDEMSKLTPIRKNVDGTGVKCESCDEQKDIKWKCEDCSGKHICEDCKNAHRLFAPTKRHTLISVESMASKFKGRLAYTVFSFEKCMSKLQSVISRGNEFKERLHKKEQSVTESIKAFRDQMIKDIIIHHDSLINAVNQATTNENHYVDDIQESIMKDIQSMCHKVCIIEEVTNTRDVRTLMEKAEVMEHEAKHHLEKFNYTVSKLEEFKFGELPEIKVCPPMTDLSSATKVDIDISSKVNIYEEIEKGRKMVCRSDSTSQSLNKSGKFESLLDATGFEKVNSIFLEGESYRLQMHEDQLWCVCENGLVVYDKGLNIVKHGRIESVRCIIKDHLGNYLVACSNNNGLLQFTADLEYNGQIVKSSYCDLALSNDQLYALEEQTSQVVVFYYKYNSWQKHHEINLPVESKVSATDTLFVNVGAIYVALRSKDTILKMATDGDIIATYESAQGKFNLNGPRICDVDKSGNILVADSFNHCLKVCNKNGKFETIPIKRGVSRPLDAVLDNQTNHLFVLTGKLLIKYKIKP